MSAARVVLLGLLVVGLSANVRANLPRDDFEIAEPSNKLIGTWTPVKAAGIPPGADIRIEFTRSGKLLVSATGPVAMKMEGSYSIKGNKLTITIKGPAGKEQKETIVIKELTRTRLVTVDPRGNVEEFKRK